MLIKKIINNFPVNFLIISLATSLTACHASISNDFAPATQLEEKVPVDFNVPSHANYLSEESQQVRNALKIYQKTGKAPIIQTSQFLQFPFGETQQVVFCEPLRACDIELQASEKVTGVFPGDSARWLYTEAYSGDRGLNVPHIIIKPTEYDITTDLIITTDKRTYYLGLVSKKDSAVCRIKYYYPDDAQAYWANINAQQLFQTEAVQNSHFNITHLDFAYSLRANKGWFGKNPTWMPLQVFNDGAHVYIQMPIAMRSSQSPALFVLQKNGSKGLVNYRVKNNFYVVDQLFKQAVLVIGVGCEQQRVLITYRG